MCRHRELYKPSASIKFWPKSFHKSSMIFDIFHITNYAWFFTFFAWQNVWLLPSQGIIDQLNKRFSCKPCLKLLQLYIHLFISQCEKYHKAISTLWKLSVFLPQFFFNNLNVDFFPFSTLCVEFFIQLTLHFVEHRLFYFQFCGKF